MDIRALGSELVSSRRFVWRLEEDVQPNSLDEVGLGLGLSAEKSCSVQSGLWRHHLERVRYMKDRGVPCFRGRVLSA